MLEQLTDVESKLLSYERNLKFLSVMDFIALDNYFQKKMDQVFETSERIRLRQNHNSHPRVSTATETIGDRRLLQD